MVAIEREPTSEKAKILIVDDNAQNAELLQVHLEGSGFAVVTALTSEDALKKVDEDPPDLILLDIMMPRISGYEVCRRLKRDPVKSSIPIIMVTALGEIEDIEEGADSGADDFLTKPVSKLELLARVRSMLRVRRLETELKRTLAYLDELHRKGHLA